MIQPDGIRAAALREDEFHPTTDIGKPITAWQRRATTLEQAVAAVNEHEARLSKIEAMLPFPASS